MLELLIDRVIKVSGLKGPEIRLLSKNVEEFFISVPPTTMPLKFEEGLNNVSITGRIDSDVSIKGRHYGKRDEIQGIVNFQAKNLFLRI